MAINLENVIEFDIENQNERETQIRICLFSSNKFYACIVSVCLYLPLISILTFPFSCDVTDLSVCLRIVFLGVFCVVYRNYTLKILMVFLIAAHLQPPKNI